MNYTRIVRLLSGTALLVALAYALVGNPSGVFAKQKVTANARVQADVQADSCPTQAFGHLIAQGWLKKNGTSTIPEDCVLPKGINRLLGRTNPPPEEPPEEDVTPPDIDNIDADATTTSAHITWDTDEPANSTVYYGTSSPVVIGDDETLLETNSTLVLSHSIILDDLEADTTYYALVTSRDEAGNTSTSSQFSFTTNEEPDNVAPIIEDVVVTKTHASSTITWHTDEASDSAVFFSTSSPVDINDLDTEVVSNGTLVNDHSIVLADLEASTTYFIVIRSRDADSNVGVSTELSFTTLVAPDVTAPIITDLVTIVGSSTLDISWMTNESATTKVYYGTSTPVDLTTADFVVDNSLTLSHDADVTGLSPDTLYYLIVESKDTADNIRRLDEFSVQTATST